MPRRLNTREQSKLEDFSSDLPRYSRATGSRGRETIGSYGNRNPGAEEGTRTPTPLRVHGPEPCASANSATSASGPLCAAAPLAACQEETTLYFTDASVAVKHARTLRGFRTLPGEHNGEIAAACLRREQCLKDRRAAQHGTYNHIDVANRARSPGRRNAKEPAPGSHQPPALAGS